MSSQAAHLIAELLEVIFLVWYDHLLGTHAFCLMLNDPYQGTVFSCFLLKLSCRQLFPQFSAWTPPHSDLQLLRVTRQYLFADMSVL